MKTKTTAAAAVAALALPSAALAHDGEKRHGNDDQRAEQKQKQKQKQEHADKSKSKRIKGKAFVVKGVDAAGLTITEGALAGQLTLDPTSANRHARRVLELTKTELRGEDTVTFGEAGDEVLVKYEGLTATDTLQPTDVVKVHGKVSRTDGKLDIRKITITRSA